ncbi:MAG TPA: paraquat-inducible protein A [Holophaga sp.]|nr:paraquat-inducible protein A [Holophaga sp.]
MSPDPLTAKGAALVGCHACGRLSPLAGAEACPRCGALLHSRKPESAQRTWAMLATAAVLYVPANLLPVMRIVSFGRVRTDTIMEGIIYFMKSGLWPLALLIFFASIIVPLLKIVILSSLLISLHRRSRWRPETRTRLYRLTVVIGRWSMVDIFVVTLMVAVVSTGALATIEPGPAAMAFALVVIATMIASHCFDPRMLWDEMTPRPQEAK